MTKRVIGNLRYARMIARLHNEIQEGILYDLPADWECVGAGCFRSVYLHKPTGVVYKVESDWSDEGYDNVTEWENARTLSEYVWNYCYIPKVEIFPEAGNVLAMEYVKGTQPGKTAESEKGRRELYKQAGFADMHAANWIWDEHHRVVPVDMASPLCGPSGRNPVTGDYADQRVL